MTAADDADRKQFFIIEARLRRSLYGGLSDFRKRKPDVVCRHADRELVVMSCERLNAAGIIWKTSWVWARVIGAPPSTAMSARSRNVVKKDGDLQGRRCYDTIS